MLKYIFRPNFNYLDIVMLAVASNTFVLGMYWITATIAVVCCALSAWFEGDNWEVVDISMKIRKE